MSSVGTGAKILTNPDAPLNLMNDPTVTLATQIGIKWEIGLQNGGAPVLDYRVTFLDPAAGVFEILQSGITVTSFVATGLTAGRTYTFEVQSRNVYGFSAYSNQVQILAAQKPSAPLAPTTEVSGSNVKISWTPPSANGSPITGYRIQIKQYNTESFFIDSTNCDGASATITADAFCLVPINILRGSPFDHPWGASIFAKIVAFNVYGYSDESAVGNGAIILTSPDAPLNVAEIISLRAATSISFNWIAGPANGGAPVIDYRIISDQSTGTDIVIATGVTST